MAKASAYREALYAYERAFNAEAYHLNQSELLGYISVDALQVAFGEQVYNFVGKGVKVSGKVERGASQLVKIGLIEGEVMTFSALTKEGFIEAISHFKTEGEKLFLNQLHLEGSGAGTIGRKTLW